MAGLPFALQSVAFKTGRRAFVERSLGARRTQMQHLSNLGNTSARRAFDQHSGLQSGRGADLMTQRLSQRRAAKNQPRGRITNCSQSFEPTIFKHGCPRPQGPL